MKKILCAIIICMNMAGAAFAAEAEQVASGCNSGVVGLALIALIPLMGLRRKD